MFKKSRLGYFDIPFLVELVSSGFGDDDQSLRIFQAFLGNNDDSPFEIMNKNADPAFAALSGRFSVVRWLYPHMDAKAKADAQLLQWMCCAVAKGGHLEILKWLRKNGCPWDDNTCHFAAKNGHLECLKWARENGCHWTVTTC